MSHFAQIDDDNYVIQVVVCDNAMPNEGLDMLLEVFGGRWVQTSYNTIGGVHILGGTPLRMNYASVGGLYDELRDAFIPPKPSGMSSWILNNETLLWEPPIPRPLDGPYIWDEATVSWVPVELPESPRD
jgi:hypothetical protein